MDDAENFDYNIDGKDEISKLYKISPKGVLLMSIVNSKKFSKNFKKPKDLKLIMEIVDEVWMSFENYSRKMYGPGDKISCIMFNKNGGDFESIRINEIDEDEPEDDNF